MNSRNSVRQSQVFLRALVAISSATTIARACSNAGSVCRGSGGTGQARFDINGPGSVVGFWIAGARGRHGLIFWDRHDSSDELMNS